MKIKLFIFWLLLVCTNLSALEPEQYKGIVNLHNTTRAARSQLPLKWSDDLAKYASQWVNHLASTQNCAMNHRPNKGSSSFKQKYGENLFWASPEFFNDGKIELQNINIKHVFNAWEEEKDYYNYQTNTCQPNKKCGHFTQIVWHETKEVGCAMATCSDKSQIWACNYSPRGNYIGEWPY